MLAGRRRPAATVLFRPIGFVEDASSRKDSYSYSCSYRLACSAQQHDSSCTISIPPYCGGSSSSSSSTRKMQKRKLVLLQIRLSFVAQADGAPSCRLLCCCLRSWDGSGGTAANSTADTGAGLPLLLALFFVFRILFCLPRCRTSPLPSSTSEASPAGFCLPHPQTHKDHDGKGKLFFSERKGTFSRHFCASTLLRKMTNDVHALSLDLSPEPYSCLCSCHAVNRCSRDRRNQCYRLVFTR